jgi:processive 1,2-diacylglycerol beta-glucosyltransferase
MIVNPEIIEQIHAQGAKVVYEIDDMLTKRTFRKEVDNPTMFIQNTVKMLKGADLVTTTTNSLAEELKKYTKKVEVIPNFIDLDWWGKPLNIKRRGNIRLGWAGSTSHLSDLVYIREPVKRILDEFENVIFVYCGAGGAASSSASTELMFGQDTFSNIPPERKEYYLGTNTETWGAKSKTLHLDIALAPLIDDEFNRCKSNIKWQEYSLNGWAGIYSDIETYSDIKGGLKAKTSDDFYNHIKYLITNPSERIKLVREAQKEVLTKWTIDNNYQKWVEVFENV